jgi:N-acetylneuraminic acid mutarotase
MGRGYELRYAKTKKLSSERLGVFLLWLIGAFLVFPCVAWADYPDIVTVPVLTPSPGGNYPGTQIITLSSRQAGTIYYTLDGTDPATSATRIQYSTPISISTTGALKYCASDVSGNVSAVQTQFYTVYSAANPWTQITEFVGTVRSYAVGFSIGNKGYIGTGWDGTSHLKDFWEYDPTQSTWTRKADFGGTERRGAVGFSIGNKGHIGTGWDGASYCRDFWEYDPALDTWTRKADFAGAARFAPVGFSIGNKGYVGTGLNGSSYYRDFWEYNPTLDAWTQKTDFVNSGRWGAAGFSIGSKGYVGAGYDGSYKKDFWEYNPMADAWTQKADFGGTSRIGPLGFSIGSKGYIGTGSAIPYYYKDFWEYDPGTDRWTQRTDLGGTGRAVTAGFSIGNMAYIGTGADGPSYYKDFWEFNANFYLPLCTGWNFISLPLTPPDTTIDQVLSPLSSKVVIVWGYDNATKAWKKWTPAGGPGNTLLTMEPGKGYWIYMDDVASLDISPWGALVSPCVTLSAGWNLVGYGGFYGREVGAVLGGLSGQWSFAWTWQNDQWYGKPAAMVTLPAPIQPLSTFSQKKAFWIKMAPGPLVNWPQ